MSAASAADVPTIGQSMSNLYDVFSEHFDTKAELNELEVFPQSNAFEKIFKDQLGSLHNTNKNNCDIASQTKSELERKRAMLKDCEKKQISLEKNVREKLKELERKKKHANSLVESIQAQENELNELEFQTLIMQNNFKEYQCCYDSVNSAKALASSHFAQLVKLYTSRYQEVSQFAEETHDEEIKKQCQDILTQIQKVTDEAKSFLNFSDR